MADETLIVCQAGWSGSKKTGVRMLERFIRLSAGIRLSIKTTVLDWAR